MMSLKEKCVLSFVLLGASCAPNTSAEDNGAIASAVTPTETPSADNLIEQVAANRWYHPGRGRHDAGAPPPPGVDASADAAPAVDAPSAVDVAPAVDALPAEYSGLRASGGQIKDGSGQVVHIHGVNHSGSEFACVDGYGFFDGDTDAASIAAMKSWNINAVRVPLNEDCWLGINGVTAAYGGANYQKAIADYVNLILSAGLYAIVDLHWNAPGTTLATGQEPMADADHAPAFWTSVATAFKASGNVLLELYNEPWPDNNQDTTAGWECWRDGGTCAGISYETAGMQTLVNAVRATGASNLLLLGGLEYSNALSQWATYAPADPLHNLAAAWHVYEGNVCSTTTCFDQIAGPLAQSFPIVATEIGDSSCDGSFLSTVAGWLDGHSLGYTAWTWNAWGSTCSEYSLISDYTGTPNGAYGLAYQTYLSGL